MRLSRGRSGADKSKQKKEEGEGGQQRLHIAFSGGQRQRNGACF